MLDKISAEVRADLTDALNTQKYGKLESYSKVAQAKEKALALFTEDPQKPEAAKLFDSLKERIFRDEMLKERRRPDGRKFDEIRKITCEVGVLPRTHGSSIFYARRNTGTGDHHARNQGRRTAHRDVRSG